jgi:hypothetical protein
MSLAESCYADFRGVAQVFELLSISLLDLLRQNRYRGLTLSRVRITAAQVCKLAGMGMERCMHHEANLKIGSGFGLARSCWMPCVPCSKLVWCTAT